MNASRGSRYPPEVKEEARQLYEEGWSINAITRSLGANRTTVKRWLDPEWAEKFRETEYERKKRYYSSCVDCGAPTSYTTKGAALRCKSCHDIHIAETKKWRRETVIEAIQTWFTLYGRPPSSFEWNSTLARRSKRGHVGPEHPTIGTVRNLFGTWGKAIEAAGFQARSPYYHGEWGRAQWTKERIIEALRSHSTNGVAPRMDTWKRRANDRPTGGWVTYVFGSWKKACHAAGLQTYREGGRAVDDPERDEKREALLRDLIEQGVLRQFLTRRLWQPWGFSNDRAMRYWCQKRQIRELAGWHYRDYRQMSEEEFARAMELV